MRVEKARPNRHHAGMNPLDVLSASTARSGHGRLLALALSLCLFAPAVRAYDYSAPMEDIAHLTLTMPQKPFVLRFSEEELLAQPVWTKKVDAILISNASEPVVRLAARTLRASLVNAGFGNAFIIELAPRQTSLPPVLEGKHTIVLGRPEDLALVRTLVDREKLTVTDEALNGDGFVVKPLRLGISELLLVTSCASRGVLYGAYEVEERTTRRGVPAIDQASVPAVRWRSWSFYNFNIEPTDVIGRSRYNLSVHYIANFPGTLPYRDYPELGGDADIAGRMAKQNALHQILADALKYGATPAIIFNPFTYSAGPSRYGPAREALSKKYPSMIAKPSGAFGTDLSHPKANIHTLNRFNLCPSDPETRRFVETGVRELVRTYPEMGVLGLMFSDEGGELICGCERCEQRPYLDRVSDYSKLIISVARSENPKLRFMPFIHAINWWIALHQPEYEKHEENAIAELYRRANGDYDAMMMLRSTPPGGDLQSWLFPKSTLLGKGVPIFFFFHSYEAGGPGVVAPLSTVLSHLSWPLPVYLEHLQDFLKPGQGMVGGASPVTGMEVAWWYPQLDPEKYIANWSRAKYGASAGGRIAQALSGTHRITETFYLEGKADASESFTLYRWRPENYIQRYQGDMTKLRTLAQDGVTAAEGLAIFDFMVPQARQPASLDRVQPAGADAWRARFEIKEAVASAARADTLLAKVFAEQPISPDLRRLSMSARATRSLTLLFREYHLALLEANLARNTAGAPGSRPPHATRSAEHLRQAIRHVVDYAGVMLAVTASDPRPSLARFRLDMERLYVGTPLCMVREAAFQFDQEFGGENLTAFYDEVIAAQAARKP